MKTNKYAGTKTEANLRAAFAGESQARNQYTFFASVAKKEGYEQMAALFLKTAENEKEHAKMWFKECPGYRLHRTICSPPLRAKTTSGPTCTILSPRPQRKRAFPSWRRSSASSARSNAITKSATARCCATSRPPRSLKRARSRSGSAATAATSSSAPRPRRLPHLQPPPELLRNPRGELLRIDKLTEPQAVPAALVFTYSFCQQDADRRALALFAMKLDCTVMILHGVLDDGKAEPVPPLAFEWLFSTR